MSGIAGLGRLRIQIVAVFLLLSTIPPLLVGAFITHRSFVSLEAQGLVLLHEVAVRVTAEVLGFMRSREERLLAVESRAGFTQLDATRQREMLEELLLRGGDFQEITLVDAGGRERVRVSRTEYIAGTRLTRWTGRDEFEHAAGYRSTYFGPVRFDPTIREPLTTVASPVIDRRDGTLVAVLIGEVRFKHLWNRLADLELPESVDVFLTGLDGRVLGHRNPATVLGEERLDLAALARRMLWRDGTDVLTSTSRLTLGDQSLRVVAIQPASVALALGKTNLRITAMVLAVAVVLAMALGVLATRAIARPIEDLAAAVQQLRSPGHVLEVPASSQREARLLGQAFSQVLRELGETMQGLEAEVEERRHAEGEALARAQELERTTDELREAQDRLVRRERLATLGQMAGELGHELRNPLAVINNATTLLQRTLNVQDDKTRRSLNLIASRVHEINKLTGDLLSWARASTPQRQAVTVPTLMEELLRRSPPPAGIEARVDVRDDTPAVYVDVQQIGQILRNLASNAYEAMHDGGRLTITATALDDRVRVAVTDTGEGIPHELLDQIFQPLFTTKARGIGFGLAICRSLAEINGGELAVESTAGRGTTFHLTVPRVAA